VARTNDFQEIAAKRFSHKRAILYEHVMIEFLLVQGTDGDFFTDFFSGRYRLAWPADVFCHGTYSAGDNVPIASKGALRTYRQHHKQIEKAYRTFLQTAHGGVPGTQAD